MKHAFVYKGKNETSFIGKGAKAVVIMDIG